MTAGARSIASGSINCCPGACDLALFSRSPTRARGDLLASRNATHRLRRNAMRPSLSARVIAVLACHAAWLGSAMAQDSTDNTGPLLHRRVSC